MNDNDNDDLIRIIEQYEQKKRKAEQDYQKQKTNIKNQFLNSLLQKEEETKNKIVSLKSKLDGIIKIRNILETDDDKEISELKNIAKETKEIIENCDNNQLKEGKDIEENNGMAESDIKEGLEEIEEPKKDEFDGKATKFGQMTSQKRHRPSSADNN